MVTKRRLRGYELRCVLTLHLFQNGITTVDDLIDMLDYHGFEVAGRPSKAVSDALRCEMEHGRVRRVKRGRYGPDFMPRATEHRIHTRALALRDEAAQLGAKSSSAIWDAFFEGQADGDRL
jgi:hypothetical protein